MSQESSKDFLTFKYEELDFKFETCFHADFECMEIYADLGWLDLWFDTYPEYYPRAVKDWKDEVFRQFDQYAKDHVKEMIGLYAKDEYESYRYFFFELQKMISS